MPARGRPSRGFTESAEVYLSPDLLREVTRAAKARRVARCEWLRQAAVFFLAYGSRLAQPELADDDAPRKSPSTRRTRGD